MIDVFSNRERMSLGSFALYAPEIHKIQYMPVKGLCCNLWEPDVRRKEVELTISRSCLTLWRNPLLIVSANRRRPALNFSFVGWTM